MVERGHDMVWHKGYILAAILLVTLLTNLLVANAALLMGSALTQGLGLVLSLAVSLGLTGLFAWSLIHQAQNSARTAEELRRIVFRDRLTNVATRDFFFERLAREPGAEGVVLMVDIDHFKAINDTHGHVAGDAVIRKVASQLRYRCRSDDIVCRFGGEEFLVFLQDGDAARGEAVAERLRAAVAQAVTPFEGEVLRATVSVGAACKTAEMKVDAAIRQADDALYRAKRLGRNRVELDWAPARQQRLVPLRRDEARRAQRQGFTPSDATPLPRSV